jgi:hypothetical protein
MDNLTADEADQLLTLTLIAITALFAVLSAIGLWLGRKAVRYVAALVGIKESDQLEKMADGAITAGIHLANEWAQKTARGLIKGPTTSEAKLEVAKHTARSLAPEALVNVPDEKLEVMIEAKLQSMRPWLPPSSSSPTSFSLPPPSKVPSFRPLLRTPIPPKART